MNTRRLGIGAILMGLVLLTGLEPSGQAQEKKKRPPIWTRLTKGTCVVIGEVTAVDPKPIEAVSDARSKEKRTYRVATIKVSEVLLGAKDLKEVKVGFYTEGELKPEQDGCFILAQHFVQPFFVFPDPQYDRIYSDNINYNLWTKTLRDAGHCLDSPKEMLHSQEGRERLLTASILISRYRDSSVGTKTELIDAEESKLLLRALRDADWGKEDKSYRLMPQPLFEMLGLTEKDGWNPPKKAADQRRAAEDWLIDNHGKYRIQRFVPDAPAKK